MFMKLDKYLDDLLIKLEKENLKQNNWNISKQTGEYLYKLILKHKPKTIIEVGASNGYSTIWLCLAAKEINAEVISYEYVPEKILMLVKNIQKARLVNYLTIIPDNANKRLDKLKREIDFLFLDSRKNEYLQQLKLVEPLLSKKAVIVADNAISHKNELEEYFNYVRINYKSQLVDIGTGLEISRNK